MSRKVVITGLGAITPLGGDVASTWSGMLAGRSGVRLLTDPAYADLPARLAAPTAADPAEMLPRATARKLDRHQQLALAAALEAWKDSGLADLAGTDRAVPGERLAVSISSCIGGVLSLCQFWDTLREKGPRHASPFNIAKFIPDGAASWVGLEIGAKAAIQTPLAACATGNEALRDGAKLIRAGKADVVVAGGAEAALHPVILASFSAMKALSQRNDEPDRASRPFDKNRDGFVMGEGAAMMVLESAEHAAGRGARVYAEMAGLGVSADGYDFAQPDPTGTGQTAAMREAIDDAGLTPGQFAHVNAHAASTPLGDAIEAASIRSVFGSHADSLVVTAPKSAIGHLFAAAGVAESIATVLALHHRVVPPSINIEDLDDEINLDVAREPRELPGGPLAALSNSFGLGGHNVVIAFRTA